jgi:antirestriction protein ArdC
MKKRVYKKRDESAEPKKSFAEDVAERLIAMLEAGTAPWQASWLPGEKRDSFPLNVVSGKRYNGINLLMLMFQGYSDPRWMTFKQATDKGYSVRKGEKGTRVQFWSFEGSAVRTGEDGAPVLSDDGKPVTDKVKRDSPFVRYAYVFNAQQIDGIPALEVKEPQEPKAPGSTWEHSERAEAIIEASAAKIFHDGGSQAFYRTIRDSIHMPDRSQFPDAPSYYEVLFHELGHWSGHSSRLNRDMSGSFGTPSYAKEELRAEIASMLIGEALDLGHDASSHASYVADWIQVLKKDPMEIFRAASDAEKILKFILSFDPSLTKEVVQDINAREEPDQELALSA